MNDFDMWVAVKWTWLLAAIAAVAHSLIGDTVMMVAAGVLPSTVTSDVAFEQLVLVCVNVSLLFGVFGPLIEPAIATENGWVNVRKQRVSWRIVRLTYLAAILTAGLMWGRLLGAALSAVAG